MGKLVDTDELYAAFRRDIMGGLNYDRILREAKPVDAVPVVRCKDCRFWSKYPGSSAAPQYHECMARMTYIGNMYTTAWEYCSRGERKDGDNEQDKKS